ncbi:MCP four helix bundle domain-containing protein, partial [Modestobacter sp. I12A-02662]|uniref:MCP four helix bundle domain-containing protein n=1 Tax=Modestobacter sp. I12A-02662 TaxID=1730496 RepID=UPI0034DE7FEC
MADHPRAALSPDDSASGGKASWWGDRGVSTKILTAVGAAGLVAGVVGFTGLTAMGSGADRTQHLYSANVQGIVEATAMRGAVKDMRVGARNVVLQLGSPGAQQAVEDVVAAGERFEAAHSSYEALELTAEKRALADSAAASFTQYEQLSVDVLAPLALTGDVVGWNAANTTQVSPVAAQVEDSLNELVGLEKQAAADAAAEARSEYQSQRTVALVVLVVGVAVALGLGFAVARGIARSVGRVRAVTDALAEGDLTRSSGLHTRDELGLMGASLDAAVHNLRGLMTTVAGSADAVAASSEELSASSAQISASAEETSAQSGVVSAAAEEVSRNVGTVAAG